MMQTFLTLIFIFSSSASCQPSITSKSPAAASSSLPHTPDQGFVVRAPPVDHVREAMSKEGQAKCSQVKSP
ncbi:hypothetical protein [Candidatus Nitrososphaera gargensis]|uniref:hypothetical protein n=1 Tax=Candidatus Nitrososphaera gargensis TaxID=497727 RepID=UPI001E543E68|nr:hypothetical protein [Candidatus Nitrososphaera gargensis]